MQQIFDSHCHIDMVKEKGITNENIIEGMKENKVEGFIQIAADSKAVDYAQKFVKEDHPFKVYYTIGQHPGEVDDVDTNICLTKARESKLDNQFVAIGEIGLDYFYGAEYKEKQIEVFDQYLDIALELQKPVCIHTRDAHQDTLIALKKLNNQVDILIHCFTGNLTEMNDFLEIGCYISFSGIVTFKNAKELQEAALHCPIDRMLVETDAPFLTPTPFRGKTNHPGLTRYTLNFIADLKGVDRDYLADATRKNTYDFYDIQN